ncbi:MAG: ABC transporter ATP-binding protein [Pseudomonadota bacterium]
MPNQPIVLSCDAVSKSYVMPSGSSQVLKHVHFEVKRGEQWAITGRSGSGKSSLLHILGGMDAPTTGQVWVSGQPLYQVDEHTRACLLNQHIGFVFQHHYLLGDFNAAENVAMPLLIRGVGQKAAMNSATALLKELGLEHRLAHRPSQLSGGERQRVALARAVVGNPAIVLADEPTGNLDPETGAQVYALMDDLAQKYGMSFVVVTHDMRLAQNRLQAHLVDGTLELI